MFHSKSAARFSTMTEAENKQKKFELDYLYSSQIKKGSEASQLKHQNSFELKKINTMQFRHASVKISQVMNSSKQKNKYLLDQPL